MKLFTHSQTSTVTHICQWARSALVQVMAWGQAITWTIAALMSIGPLRTNFCEILIKMQNFSFMEMHLKMLSAKVAAILSRGTWVKFIIELTTLLQLLLLPLIGLNLYYFVYLLVWFTTFLLYLIFIVKCRQVALILESFVIDLDGGMVCQFVNPYHAGTELYRLN